MTSENEFERLLTTWLVEEAPAREPQGLLPRAMDHVGHSRRQPAWVAIVRGTAMGRSAVPSRLALLLMLVALLVMASVGAALIGSGGRLPFNLATPSPLPTWGSSLPQVFGLPGRFAFASNRDGELDVYAMDPDRTNLVQLTDVPGDDVSPFWSPDGTRVAFQSNRSGDMGIYVIQADGAGERLVVNGPGDEILGAWSPDGTQIAYADAGQVIHIINVDGTGDREVQVRSSGTAYGPTVYGWMPTGDELLIVFDKSPEGGDLDVYRLRIADGQVIALTSSPVDDGGPAVSPDGSTIAFQSDRNGGCLYVMDADGSNVVRLTTGCSKGFPKAWAPDGRLIGWAGARRSDFDQPQDIQIIRPDGSGRTRLTDSDNVFDLAWGPSH